MTPAEILTVGHSVHPIERFVALLRGHAVAGVIDVRRIPRSRRHPQFDRDALRAALAAAGIGYRHMPQLGGLLDQPRPGAARHGAIASEMLRRYADHAHEPAWQRALAALVEAATGTRAAVMCAEADWRHCHRQIITDYLVAGGHPVAHILSDGRLETAQLAAAAVVRPDRLIDYPAAASPQLDLF